MNFQGLEKMKPLFSKPWKSLLAAVMLIGVGCQILQFRATPPGLYVRNGVLTKDGQPYRGIGVNYFDCFLRVLGNGTNTSYDAGFRKLAEYHIPFARFCATGFWPRDMQLYQTNRAEYFRRLDGVVRSAELRGVGLIPSLFWLPACVPDLVGEPLDQWANPQSKTIAWMRNYVREVVTRYKDSPAIWAWEFGNEYSLHANLPNPKTHRAPVYPALGMATERSELDFGAAIRRELRVQMSFGYTAADFKRSLDLLIAGEIDLTEWTAEMSLEDGQEAFERMTTSRGDTLKMILRVR